MLGAHNDLSTITRWAGTAGGGIRRRAASGAAMVFTNGDIAFTAIQPMPPITLGTLMGGGIPFIIATFPTIPVTAAMADMLGNDLDEALLTHRAGFISDTA